MKNGEYITTYTGINFYVLEPEIDCIIPIDIAHALSFICRANGHCSHFYSVAQHCINCAAEAKKRGYSNRVQLACLMHDGSEAYIADITRPLKRMLSQYLVIEKLIQSKIYERFGLADLTADESEKVSSVDDAMLYHEFIAMHGIEIWDKAPFISMEHDFSQRDMPGVEKDFLDLLASFSSIYNNQR